LKFRLCSSLILVLALSGCATSTHPLGAPAPGKAINSAEMEQLIDRPGPIELTTIASVDWAVPLDGLVNLKSPTAIAAGLTDHDEPIQVYAHVLHHPQRGYFLVDTGVAQSVLDDPGKAGVSWLVRRGMPVDTMKMRKSTAAIVHDLPSPLQGVMLTHMHLDHIGGLPEVPGNVPIYIGPGESTHTSWINVLMQGTTDNMLKDKAPLQEWPFQPDAQQRFDGIVDVFGDGSVFAISVPGHTAGSVAYLVRTTRGPVLLTGDTSHTRWGWEHTVEPGDYTDDKPRNLVSLKQLKALVAAHPSIEVRFGHQP
jgi:N-acyl homoserine lactone hydrolase